MNAKDQAGGGLLTVEQAIGFLLAEAVPVTGTEWVGLSEASGRVLAESQESPLSVPPHDNSAMDGYAVSTADLKPGVDTRLRVAQRIPAGAVGEKLAAGTAARIFTGAPIPPGADAVVMQERCREEGNAVLLDPSVAVHAGDNIRRAGEDIREGGELLRAGTRLRPQELGLAASVGIGCVPVFRRFRIALFSTGDELVEPGQPLGPGQIYNSNRYALIGLLRDLGCEVVDLGCAGDTLPATLEILERASAADLIITTGGVSVGEEDHVKSAVSQMGSLDLWRIAVKPGKPLAFGRVGGTPFLGLPGNPVSSFVTCCLFARPFILRSQGVSGDVLPTPVGVPAGFDWLQPISRREYLRARLQPEEDGGARAVIFPHQGSGVLTSVAWAHGLVEVPESTPVRRGDRVRYYPFSDLLK